MTNTAKPLNDISDIFSILHDGTTSTWAGDKDLLILRINCEYLAELIDKSFQSFYVECSQIDKIEFHPWMNPSNLPQTLLMHLNDIFQAELEVLSAEIDNDHVKISCNQHNTDFDYCGGTLLLSCKTIKVFDQEKRELSIDEFDKLCTKYWDKFAQEIE